MAKLRHLALLTHQPDKLTDYYKRVFDTQEMYRTKTVLCISPAVRLLRLNYGKIRDFD
jgi:hypothetical protein